MAFEPPKEATKEVIEQQRGMASILGGEGAVEYLESVPTMSSAELINLVSGEPYPHLKTAALAELGDRLAILDALIFAHRANAIPVVILDQSDITPP